VDSLSAPPRRIPQLDLLRGIAVLLVIAHHYGYFSFLRRTGWAGVDLFFVLSGFLISGLLFSDWKQHGRLSIGRFFIRRGFKIYPAFYVFLLLTIPLGIIMRRGQALPRFASECVFLQDYLPHVWDHTWSLAVEEQFYLLLPLLLLLFTKLRPATAHRAFRWIPAVSLVLLAVCLGLRLHAHAERAEQLIAPLHYRADALFLGVALGYWFHFHESSFRAFSSWWCLPFGLAFLLPLAVFGRDLRVLPFVFTSNSLGFALLLCWILSRRWVRFRPLESAGFHSYSIYLWHFPVTMIARLFPITFPMFCINMAACYVTGAGMGTAVERRALALRDRLFPSPAALQMEAAPAETHPISTQLLADRDEPAASLSPGVTGCRPASS
jgi:peptidoglycan/LPS O-acetylase OafA/YrhL